MPKKYALLGGVAAIIVFSLVFFFGEIRETFGGRLIALGPVDPKNLHLVFRSSGTTAATLVPKSASGVFAVNGPYFQEPSDGSLFRPAGLLVRSGKSLGTIDRLDPNLSYFLVLGGDSRPSVIRRDDITPERLSSASLAFQTGPLLVSSGAVVEQSKESWHALEPHERTAIWIDRSGKIWFFVSSKKRTLPELSRDILVAVPSVATAINLDGGPSTTYRNERDSFRENQTLPYFFVGKISE